jgi:hypothetical protein
MSMDTRDRRTAGDPAVEACTAVPGMEHDYREYKYESLGTQMESMRCVFCHGLRCGNKSQRDPCIEVYHHKGVHRTARGIKWPLGGTRPDR